MAWLWLDGMGSGTLYQAEPVEWEKWESTKHDWLCDHGLTQLAGAKGSCWYNNKLDFVTPPCHSVSMALDLCLRWNPHYIIYYMSLTYIIVNIIVTVSSFSHLTEWWESYVLFPFLFPKTSNKYSVTYNWEVICYRHWGKFACSYYGCWTLTDVLN